MDADWRNSCGLLGGEWKSVSVVEMSSACRLIFCSKSYCSLNFAVSYCSCEENNHVTKAKDINLVDTKEGTFCVDSEGCWVFIGAGGHKWMIEKSSDPGGAEVELVDLGILSQENGFERKLTDCFCQIFPRILLEKNKVTKKRQAPIQLMRIHTPQNSPM